MRLLKHAAFQQRHEQEPPFEAMHWGDVADNYHKAAEQIMDEQWAEMIWPVISQCQLERTVDFACGRGRNSRKLFEAGATQVTLVDVHPDNVRHCRERFNDQRATIIRNNGVDLRQIADSAHTLVYSWDAMVHFDVLVIGKLSQGICSRACYGRLPIHASFKLLRCTGRGLSEKPALAQFYDARSHGAHANSRWFRSGQPKASTLGWHGRLRLSHARAKESTPERGLTSVGLERRLSCKSPQEHLHLGTRHSGRFLLPLAHVRV